MDNSNVNQNIVDLSAQMWQLMADKDADSLIPLFHADAVFVHMGGSFEKDKEIQMIRTGEIWYKKADIHSVSVSTIGDTAILLNNMTLYAVVGTFEVTTLFIVTEVYIKQNDNWQLGSMSFTKQLTASDMPK